MPVSILSVGVKRMGPDSFQWCPAPGQGANGHKPKLRKFHLNMRKNFFPLRVAECWNRLPRDVVDSPSLEILKTHLDKVLCSLLQVTCFGRGFGVDDPQRSLPTPTFCDSVICM